MMFSEVKLSSERAGFHTRDRGGAFSSYKGLTFEMSGSQTDYGD